jgi:hypothetical protein
MRLIKMNFVPPPLISDPQAQKEPQEIQEANSKVARALHFHLGGWPSVVVVCGDTRFFASLLLWVTFFFLKYS